MINSEDKSKMIIATNNEKKLDEYRAMLSKQNVEIISLGDLMNVPKINEDGTTFSENALLKAKSIVDKFQITTMADDSGLLVEALGGEPGVLSARYAGNHNDGLNREKVLANLQHETNRRATFHTSIVAIRPNGQTLEVSGEINGEIVLEPRGSQMFGYDSIFQPDGCQQTFGEMTSDQKSSISHRGLALKNLIAQFDSWWV